MSKNYRKALENLDLFLAGTEGQTTEEIAKQLKEENVNAEEFLAKVKQAIGSQSLKLASTAPVLLALEPLPHASAIAATPKSS